MNDWMNAFSACRRHILTSRREVRSKYERDRFLRGKVARIYNSVLLGAFEILPLAF